MPNYSDLVERMQESCIHHGTCAPCRRDPPEQRCTTCKAADALEAQEKEIERLREIENGEAWTKMQLHCEALREKLAEAAKVAADEARELAGESVARAVYHAVKTLLRALDGSDNDKG